MRGSNPIRAAHCLLLVACGEELALAGQPRSPQSKPRRAAHRRAPSSRSPRRSLVHSQRCEEAPLTPPTASISANLGQSRLISASDARGPKDGAASTPVRAVRLAAPKRVRGQAPFTGDLLSERPSPGPPLSLSSEQPPRPLYALMGSFREVARSRAISGDLGRSRHISAHLGQRHHVRLIVRLDRVQRQTCRPRRRAGEAACSTGLVVETKMPPLALRASL